MARRTAALYDETTIVSRQESDRLEALRLAPYAVREAASTWSELGGLSTPITPTGVIPEPGTLALLGLSGGVFLPRRLLRRPS